jgi:hypothetical protein
MTDFKTKFEKIIETKASKEFKEEYNKLILLLNKQEDNHEEDNHEEDNHEEDNHEEDNHEEDHHEEGEIKLNSFDLISKWDIIVDNNRKKSYAEITRIQVEDMIKRLKINEYINIDKEDIFDLKAKLVIYGYNIHNFNLTKSKEKHKKYLSYLREICSINRNSNIEGKCLYGRFIYEKEDLHIWRELCILENGHREAYRGSENHKRVMARYKEFKRNL